MRFINFRPLRLFALLLPFLLTLSTTEASGTSEDDGTLVVLISGGDAFNSPVPDAYVEAHGWVPKYHSEKSFVFKSPRAGRYEASLPPAIYDVFVSEGVLIPACKRVLVKAGSTTSLTLQLGLDQVYTEK